MGNVTGQLGVLPQSKGNAEVAYVKTDLKCELTRKGVMNKCGHAGTFGFWGGYNTAGGRGQVRILGVCRFFSGKT